MSKMTLQATKQKLITLDSSASSLMDEVITDINNLNDTLKKLEVGDVFVHHGLKYLVINYAKAMRLKDGVMFAFNTNAMAELSPFLESLNALIYVTSLIVDEYKYVINDLKELKKNGRPNE